MENINHQQIKLYMPLYCYIYLCVGLLAGSIGPVIPYLAAERGVLQTDYSFLFMARTMGSMFGLLLLKYLQKRHLESMNKMIGLGAVTNSIVALVFMKSKSDLWAGISIAVIEGAHYVICTACSVCVLAISEHHAGSSITLINAMFGVGALLSPLIIRQLQTQAYYIYAAAYLVGAGLSFYLPTPIQVAEQPEKNNEISTERSGITLGSRKMVVLVGLGLFLISGIESTFSGWMPSYAVNTDIFELDDAAICCTLFWGMSTLFRFLSATIPLPNTLKLKMLVLCILTCSVMCLLLHELEQFYALVVGGSILFGMSCSAVFPLITSISTDYGLTFSSRQMSTIMIVPTFSNFLIACVVGELMERRVSLLFYSILAVSIALWFDSRELFRTMEKEGLGRQSEMKEALLLPQKS